MICCAVFRTMCKTLKISLFFATFLISSASWCQQFDVTLTQNLGGYTSDDPAIFREFVHCKSINEGRTVSVGTVDGLSQPLRWFFIEVDSLGVKVLSNCRQIESSPNTRSIILMDIQMLRNKSGYVACGYQFLNTNPAILKPLSVLFDGSGVPTSSYTYDDSGMFTKVVQNTNGDFVFVGSKGNSTFIKNGNRTACVITTDSVLIQKYYITIPGVISTESFDIISDIVVKSKDSVIIAGSITTNCSSGGGLKAQSLLMSINPNNGVVHWHQNVFNTNVVSPKLTLAMDTLYVIFNAGVPNKPVIGFFSAADGSFIDGRFIKIDPIFNCDNQYINADTVLFQNIIVLNANRIFVSGKVIQQNGQFPLEIELNKSNFNIRYANAYFSKYKSPNFDGMSYSIYHMNAGCLSGYTILPISSVRSSVMNSHGRITSINPNTFAQTLAGPFYSYFPWLFSNNFSSVTGWNTINVSFISLPPLSSVNVNVKTPSVRQRGTFALTSNSLSVQQAGCAGFVTPCNCYH